MRKDMTVKSFPKPGDEQSRDSRSKDGGPHGRCQNTMATDSKAVWLLPGASVPLQSFHDPGRERRGLWIWHHSPTDSPGVGPGHHITGVAVTQWPLYTTASPAIPLTDHDFEYLPALDEPDWTLSVKAGASALGWHTQPHGRLERSIPQGPRSPGSSLTPRHPEGSQLADHRPFLFSVYLLESSFSAVLTLGLEISGELVLLPQTSSLLVLPQSSSISPGFRRPGLQLGSVLNGHLSCCPS